MERKTIAGLIAIVAIVAIPMFAGCIDEEEVTPPPSPIPTSTPTSLVTPAPTHSPVPYTGPEVEYPGSPTNVTLPTIPSNQSLIPPSMYYPYNLFPESGASDVSLDTYISVSFTRPPGILKLEIEPEAKISHVKKELILYSGRYTFYLAEPLQRGTNYTVTITVGQEAPPGPGYAPTLTTSWEFTTTNTGIASRDSMEASSSKPIIVVNSSVMNPPPLST